MKSITVREHAKLTTDQVNKPSLDLHHIDESAFHWLCKLNSNYKIVQGAPIADIEDTRTLYLDNYVGVIQTPCGWTIEILPKTFEKSHDIETSRLLLRTMIENALNIQAKKTGSAMLDSYNYPLSEWIFHQFLIATKQLLNRGIRSNYKQIECTERYLQGQLRVAQQLRQPISRQHYFELRYDIYQYNRAENRLLKKTLEYILVATQNPHNKYLATDLHHLLTDIPSSSNISKDFIEWKNDRLMAYYQPIKPWCEMILNQIIPLSLKGFKNGMSLLFPMERLFERYVESSLRKQYPNIHLESQLSTLTLCHHRGHNIFSLRPDLLIAHEGINWILDTKWKRLNQNKRQSDINQQDLYQMFAYGHKYLKGKGELILIYPALDNFQIPLEPFHFAEDHSLTLWVLPFIIKADIASSKLVLHPEMTLNLTLID